jgi:protein phosphatase
VFSRPGPSKVNEDRFGADGELFSLADGMGGLALGDLAASVAVRALHSAGPRTIGALEQAMFTANSAVRALAHERNRSVGTTLLAILVLPDALLVINAGDTRAYVGLDGDPLVPVTQDDTRAAQEDVEFGDKHYTELSRIVTRSLGQHSILEVAAKTLAGPESSARIVMTSDGVHDVLPLDCLRDRSGVHDPGTAARELVEGAVEAGTEDDATVLVLDVARWSRGE